MTGRSHPFAIAFAVAAVLVLGTGWLLWRMSDIRRLLQPTAGTYEPDAGRAAPGGVAATGPHAEAGTAGSSVALPPGAAAAATGRLPDGQPPPIPALPPEEGPDGQSWRNAKLALNFRELGAMGPYVRIGIDSARGEMEFCFRRARAAAGGAASDPQSYAERSQPAVLLLYLEAREGNIDVVEARTDNPGTLSPELVACCLEVLRGLEIPAYNPPPGRRYRMKYQLE